MAFLSYQKIKNYIIFALFSYLFVFSSSNFGIQEVKAQTSISCAPLGTGQEVCINLQVPGNVYEESMTNFWPLVLKATWKYGGINRRWGSLLPYKLQIKVESPRWYEGQLSTPVDFVKNSIVGYWEPDKNLNLRWFVVNFYQSNFPFMWAKGDIRYNRDTLYCVKRYRYDSLDPSKPPYIIMPSVLKPNPYNNGLINSFNYFQQYSSCDIKTNSTWYCLCDLQLLPHKNSWFIGVTNAKVKVPFFGNVWVDAKRIEFVEVSVPLEEQKASAPYVNDRNIACRKDSSGSLVYRGVREDWYFVKNIGPVLIITRQVGMPPDYECIYDIARQDLTFQNADTYSYLVAKDYNGYDPNWDFPLLPINTSLTNYTGTILRTTSTITSSYSTLNQNECTYGQRQCVSSSSYKICGNYDYDPYTEWSKAITCPTGTFCYRGYCIFSF
jgi:hypothetical protein